MHAITYFVTNHKCHDILQEMVVVYRTFFIFAFSHLLTPKVDYEVLDIDHRPPPPLCVHCSPHL